MPIKGLSEIVRLPRLGKIRLGIKEVGHLTKNPYPRPVDHFVCPEEVKKVFGQKPRELRVMFPTEDDKQWAQQWLKCYSATRGLICRGDGDIAIARVNTETGEIATRDAKNTELREIRCDPEKCQRHQKSQCRRIMSLQFLLPDCPGFGVYQIDTGSFFSIVNINSSIDLVRSLCGRIAMLPLSLKLVEQEVQPEGSKKKVHVLNLTLPYTLAEIQKYAQIPPSKVLLPTPDTEAPDDLFPQEIIDQDTEVPSDKEETLEDIPFIDEKLLQCWDMAKGKIKTLGLKESQVARWFQKQGIEVTLKDFEPAFPSDKFTAEALGRFVDSLSLYEERSNVRSKDRRR